MILIFMAIHNWAIHNRNENLPFQSLIVIFIGAYIGFATNNLPYIIPQQITFMQAKSDDSALLFMLFGAIVLIPLLLFYTSYAY